MFWPDPVWLPTCKAPEWKTGPAPSVPPIVREALKQALSVLNTAANEKPEDIGKPERRRVINRRMKLIRDALNVLPPEA